MYSVYSTTVSNTGKLLWPSTGGWGPGRWPGLSLRMVFHSLFSVSLASTPTFIGRRRSSAPCRPKITVWSASGHHLRWFFLPLWLGGPAALRPEGLATGEFLAFFAIFEQFSVKNRFLMLLHYDCTTMTLLVTPSPGLPKKKKTPHMPARALGRYRLVRGRNTTQTLRLTSKLTPNWEEQQQGVQASWSTNCTGRHRPCSRPLQLRLHRA